MTIHEKLDNINAYLDETEPGWRDDDIMPMPDPLVDAVALSLMRNESVRVLVGHHWLTITWLDTLFDGSLEPHTPDPGRLFVTLNDHYTIYDYPVNIPDYLGLTGFPDVRDFLRELAWELADGR